MIRLLTDYKKSFSGLSREVWWLAFITFINRAGTMVIPFLSLYLTNDLNYTLDEVGWIMVCFGIGASCGAWLGGKLTDLFGFYSVMFGSLFLSGFIFIGLQFLEEFWELCFGFFFLTVVADMFRPATFVALSTYSKPENRTRSLTLVRLAINLGFSMGPALGGIIIAGLDYTGLFWVDGITCILASFLLIYLLDRRRAKKSHLEEKNRSGVKVSAYKDPLYLLFLTAIFLVSFVFMQYFSTMPLFYKNVAGLSEKEIGYILGLNGFLIFVLEMPLIKYFEQDRFSKIKIIIVSALAIGFSVLIVSFSSWIGVLLIGMILMSVGEMLNFPFSNSLAMNRSKRGKQGEYMGLYTLAYSLSHIFSHKVGMTMIEKLGYNITWYTMFGIILIACLLFYRVLVLAKRT
ncbi:hypothetical protein UJ101_02672 [Flavobacteriaceae bacterium UJ101]|nr:hypothetical protein UJ101_02672 [Flavobacteriaceae bacterium UJ101]